VNGQRPAICPSRRLDHIHPAPALPLGPRTVLADAIDDQSVAGDAEVVLAGDLIPQGDQSLVLELQQAVALGAMEMVVLRIAVIVLVDGPPVEHKLAEQPSVDKLRKRPIDRRPADVPRLPGLRQLLHQLVGIKVLVVAEDMVHQRQPLRRHAHPAALQELNKPVPRGEGNLHGTERIGISHGITY
jgi:hypothetical protein